MDHVIIIGASGHARVCLEILEAQARKVVAFYDDDPKLAGTHLHGYPILGNIGNLISEGNKDDHEFFVAIGSNNSRKTIVNNLKKNINIRQTNAIHPSSIISMRTSMGVGNFIAAGVIINTGTVLKDNVIINTGATIDHDNFIDNYAQISPGCNLAGGVIIEEGVFIGTGAVIIPGIRIGAFSIIGAGAVVIRDIPPYCTAVGIPARVIKKLHCNNHNR